MGKKHRRMKKILGRKKKRTYKQNDPKGKKRRPRKSRGLAQHHSLTAGFR